jgi:hypothetical protein
VPGAVSMNIPLHQSTRAGPIPVRGKAPGVVAGRAGAPPLKAGRGLGASRASTAGTGRTAGAEAVAPAPRAVTAGWTELPSARLKNVKCADPFATKAEQFKTKFGSVFNSGGIPCRLHHGAANVSLKWSKDPCLLDFDPLLVICAEGLCETEHPYAFASRACFGELLASENGGAKAAPLLARVVPSLRAALVSPNKKVFAGGLDAVIQLSEAVGDELNPHIDKLVVQMNKRSSDRELAPTILKAMQTLEENGGPEALPVIKGKVPTYCSVNM